MKYIRLMDSRNIRNGITQKPLTKKQTYEALNPALPFQKTKEDKNRHAKYIENLLQKLYNTNNIEELEIYIYTWGNIKNEQGKLYITSKSNRRKVISCYLNDIKWILDDIIHLENNKHMEDYIKQERKEINKLPKGKIKEDQLYANKTTNKQNILMNKMVEIQLENHIKNYVKIEEELPLGSTYIPGMRLDKICKYNKEIINKTDKKDKTDAAETEKGTSNRTAARADCLTEDGNDRKTNRKISNETNNGTENKTKDETDNETKNKVESKTDKGTNNKGTNGSWTEVYCWKKV